MKNQLIGLVLGLVLGTTITYMLFQNGFTPPKINNAQNSNLPFNQVSKSTIEVPIAINDPAVNIAGVNYSLSGKVGLIKAVQGKDNEWELTFIGKAGNIITSNPLNITDKTPITKSASSSANIKVTELKQDDPIMLNYFYDLGKKHGFVTSIQLAQ